MCTTDLHWRVVESYNQSQPYINIVIYNLTMKFKITLCTRKPCRQRSPSLHYRAVVMVTSYNVREWINGEFHHFIAFFPVKIKCVYEPFKKINPSPELESSDKICAYTKR